MRLRAKYEISLWYPIWKKKNTALFEISSRRQHVLIYIYIFFYLNMLPAWSQGRMVGMLKSRPPASILNILPRTAERFPLFTKVVDKQFRSSISFNKKRVPKRVRGKGAKHTQIVRLNLKSNSGLFWHTVRVNIIVSFSADYGVWVLQPTKQIGPPGFFIWRRVQNNLSGLFVVHQVGFLVVIGIIRLESREGFRRLISNLIF